MMASVSTPSASALKLVMMRWRRTGLAIWRMSSVLTLRRPRRMARALAPSTRYWAARGPAPQERYSLMKAGADVDLANLAGVTPLMGASFGGSAEIDLHRLDRSRCLYAVRRFDLGIQRNLSAGAGGQRCFHLGRKQVIDQTLGRVRVWPAADDRECVWDEQRAQPVGILVGSAMVATALERA